MSLFLKISNFFRFKFTGRMTLKLAIFFWEKSKEAQALMKRRSED